MYLGTCSFPFVFVLVLSVYMLKVTAASFDKQGRLLQAEYAFAAAKKGGTILATKSKDKILLVSLSPKTFEYTDNIDHSLGDISSSGPFKALNKNTYICGTGVSADLRYLSDSMLEKSLDHSITFNSPMPLERLANEIAETLYENTLREGRRPYGVSILLFGRSTSSARKDLDSSVLHGEEGEDCSPLKIIEIDLLGNVHDCLLTCIGGMSQDIIAKFPEDFDPRNESSRTKLVEQALSAVKSALEEQDKQLSDFNVRAVLFDSSSNSFESISINN